MVGILPKICFNTIFILIVTGGLIGWSKRVGSDIHPTKVQFPKHSDMVVMASASR